MTSEAICFCTWLCPWPQSISTSSSARRLLVRMSRQASRFTTATSNRSHLNMCVDESPCQWCWVGCNLLSHGPRSLVEVGDIGEKEKNSVELHTFPPLALPTPPPKLNHDITKRLVILLAVVWCPFHAVVAISCLSGMALLAWLTILKIPPPTSTKHQCYSERTKHSPKPAKLFIIAPSYISLESQ